MDYLAQYREQGFAVLRGVFSSRDIQVLAREADALKAGGLRHHATWRHGNILYLIQNDPDAGRILRFMHWPAYVSEIMQRYRVDRRLCDIVEPLIGNDLKQIINELIWKPPGVRGTSYGYHQDCRFRRPAEAYRDLGGSYVQTAIAIDPHRPDNGCMRMVPGSHRRGDLRLEARHSVFEEPCDDGTLAAAGYGAGDVVDIELDPGDVALWGPYMVHGSGPNRSSGDRRSYLNGFVIARNCDRGEWAFRDGEPCELGEQVLVQYEDLYRRPEPHYVDGAPHPYREAVGVVAAAGADRDGDAEGGAKPG